MTDEQIKHMVDRFLGWRLPEPWHPEGGVSYKRPNYAHAPVAHDWPVGTDLFDATQADAMVRHMVDGMPTHELVQRNPAVQEGLDRLRENGIDTQGLPIALNARIAFSLCMSEEALVPIMVRLRDAGLVIERRERRYRIAALLGLLAELAAEGKGMDAAEVRFQARELPMVDAGT